MRTQKLTTSPVPHSWGLDTWTESAPTVYPGTTEKARYLVRANRTQLLNAGALVRVGRQLVIMGQPYQRWLALQGARVPDYVPAPNRTAAEQKVAA